MSYEFPLPNLGAGTREDQLRQLQSFLRQHVQRLNWVLRDLDPGEKEAEAPEQGLSQEAFGDLCARLKRKQRRENFLGGKTLLCWGGPWSQGDTVPGLEVGELEKYTIFLVRTEAGPILCPRLDATLQAPGLTLTQENDNLTVTRSETPITAIYGIL